MYVAYDDILSRINDAPLWWHQGLPRFDPFNPKAVSVYARQIALVQIECQDCAARFDVAVMPNREWINLRDCLAYTSELPIVDPPNALHAMLGCAGTTMGSIQNKVIEFWEMTDVMRGWERHPEMERDLAGWNDNGEFGDSVLSRIHASEHKADWMEARKNGDFATIVSILEEFDCERPREVAHALDRQSKHKALLRELVALEKERFAPG